MRVHCNFVTLLRLFDKIVVLKSTFYRHRHRFDTGSTNYFSLGTASIMRVHCNFVTRVRIGLDPTPSMHAGEGVTLSR